MDQRTERIVLETPTPRVVGDLTLPREGYRSRLSDFLNRGEVGFIPLVDAEISERGTGAEPVRREFVAISRDYVQLAYPEAPA